MLNGVFWRHVPLEIEFKNRGILTHVDISSVLIRSKHCENESGDGIYPGRLYVSYHEEYTRGSDSYTQR